MTASPDRACTARGTCFRLRFTINSTGHKEAQCISKRGPDGFEMSFCPEAIAVHNPSPPPPRTGLQNPGQMKIWGALLEEGNIKLSMSALRAGGTCVTASGMSTRLTLAAPSHGVDVLVYLRNFQAWGLYLAYLLTFTNFEPHSCAPQQVLFLFKNCVLE